MSPTSRRGDDLIFFLNLNLRRIEADAAEQGIWGPRWKQEVLDDLLHDGQLRVSKSYNRRDPKKTVWHCRGKNISIAVVPDARHSDTLFCIGLVAGPDRGGPKTKGPIFRVAGLWGLDTMRRKPTAGTTVEEHLRLSMNASQRRQPAVGGAWNTILADKLAALKAPVPSAAKLVVGRNSSPETSSGQSSADPVQVKNPVIPRHARRQPDQVPSETADQPKSEEPCTAAPPDEPDAPAFESAGGTVPVSPEADSEPLDQTLGFAPSAAPIELTGAASWLDLCAQLLSQLDPGLEGLVDATDPLEARRGRIARLDAEMARLQAEREAVPDPDRLAQAEDLLRDLADQAARVVSEPPRRVVVDGPDRLRQLSQALADGLLEALPRWVFDQTDREERPTVAEVFDAPVMQAQLLAAARWIREEFGGAAPEGLAQIGQPSNHAPVEQLLALAWEAERGLRAIAEGLPEAVGARLRGLKAGEARAVADSIRRWRTCLSHAAFEELLAAIEEEASLRATVYAEDLSSLAPEDVAILQHLPWGEVLGFVQRRAAEADSSAASSTITAAKLSLSPAPDAPPRLLEFRHAVTDASAHVIAASIVVPEPTASAKFVGFDVPVRVYATAPIPGKIIIKLRSALFAGLPKDVDLGPHVHVLVEGGAQALTWTLEPDPDRWRPAPDGDRFEREESVRLGVTLGIAAKLRTGKAVSITLEYGSVNTSLRFDRVSPSLPETFCRTRTGIGDASATDLVRNSPLGPQTRHRKLEEVIAEGRHSFMVVAPRRFGKTTLLSHLAAVAREGNRRQVVRVTLLREIQPHQAAAEVWNQMLAELAREHEMQPVVSPQPSSLVDEGAWASIRQFVRQRGFERMTVLIDEAQAVVPRSGARWGTELKNFVERHLSECTEELATVQIGLFGTVDLSVRVGQNCRDFLLTHGAEQFAFDEASLNRFVRQVGHKHVQSSRMARVELATWAINLHTLTELFDTVQQRLLTERRLFMLRSDVADAVAKLVEADSHVGAGIWTSARSELSHSDDWDPADSMPLALAWAQQDSRLAQIERLDRCVSWLNDELRAAGGSGEVPRERADTALKDLKARGVLRDDGEFHRPLLGKLLSSRSTLLRDDTSGQLALLRLAVDVVEWPEDAASRAEGAQAKVFLAEQGGRSRAFRTSALQTDEDRRRFARTCAALRTLRDRRTRREGDEHLPKLSQAGFRADDSRQGVVVYDWVEGQPLEEVWATLAPDARVHVATQVARATSALHSRGVLHCDIAPRNVIVNGRLEAVLIDFGLARHVQDETRTRLGNDRFKAPEQCAAKPMSAEASDIYAIGQILLGPTPDEPFLDTRLLDLARRMVVPDPAKRPDIADVNEVLSEVQFDQRLHTLTRAVEEVVSDAPEFLWEDLLAYATTAALVHGRLLQWDLQRCLEVSDLLNKLFARVVDDPRTPDAVALAALPHTGDLSLAAVGHKLRTAETPLPPVWDSNEVRAVGILRIGWAHATAREAKVVAARQCLGTSQQRQVEVFRSAVERVAEAIDSAAAANGAVTRFITLLTRIEAVSPRSSARPV